MKSLLTILIILTVFITPAVAQNTWTEPARSIVPYADVSVGGTAVVVCPLDPIRKFCTIRNMSSDTHVRWGDSSITAGRGNQLRAGESMEINSIAAVYMISEGDTVQVSASAETR